MHEETTTKEKILKKVRKALIQKSVSGTNINFDSDIYRKAEEPLEIIFAQQLTKLNGKFIYCENEKELAENISLLIEENKWDHVFCFERNAKEILKKSQLSEKEFIDLLRLLLKRMVLVPVERTKPYKIEAIQIMKEIDIDDAFLIATALAFSNAVIWSEDADLKRQNVVKVVNTKEMSSAFM